MRKPASGKKRLPDAPADAVDPAGIGQIEDALTGTRHGRILQKNRDLQPKNGCLLFFRFNDYVLRSANVLICKYLYHTGRITPGQSHPKQPWLRRLTTLAERISMFWPVDRV
jgi:hypothetical protein